MVQQWPARPRSTQAAQAHVTRTLPLCWTRRCRATGDRWKEETLYEKYNTEICECLKHVESKLLFAYPPCISLCFPGHYDLAESWTSRNKNAIFFFAEIRISCKIFRLQPNKELPFPFLSARSARKKLHHFPLKSSYFYRTLVAVNAFATFAPTNY